MDAFSVEELDSSNSNDWESFNESSPDGSLNHTLKWKKILEKSLGYNSKYFLIYRDGSPVGLCPLYEVPFELKRHRIAASMGLCPRRLAPLPASDFRHIILMQKADEEIIRQLIDGSMMMGKKTWSSDVLLVTSHGETRDAIGKVCRMRGVYCEPVEIQGYLLLDMDILNPQKLWSSFFNSRDSQRKYIQRFEKAGFEIREAKSEMDIKIFYKYYSENLRSIGATPLDFKHLRMILDEFVQEEFRMTFLENNGVIAGGLFTLLSKQFKTAHLYLLALNRDLPGTFHPPYALFWDAINNAYDNGYRTISFGPGPIDKEVRSVKIKKDFGAQYHEVYATRLYVNPIYKMICRMNHTSTRR